MMTPWDDPDHDVAGDWNEALSEAAALAGMSVLNLAEAMDRVAESYYSLKSHLDQHRNPDDCTLPRKAL